jgi:uncharacterized coiled-coil DUF342 family protein
VPPWLQEEEKNLRNSLKEMRDKIQEMHSETTASTKEINSWKKKSVISVLYVIIVTIICCRYEDVKEKLSGAQRQMDTLTLERDDLMSQVRRLHLVISSYHSLISVNNMYM